MIEALGPLACLVRVTSGPVIRPVIAVTLRSSAFVVFTVKVCDKSSSSLTQGWASSPIPPS